MFSSEIKTKFPFLDKYFSLLVNKENKPFCQSVIFWGEDIFAQYLLAQNLAKILNCTKDKSINCDCLNCSWVKTNMHPAVITVSKNDFKPDDDSSKTVISVKQVQAVKNLLTTTSEYHRVFIFCDSEIKTPAQREEKQADWFKSQGFSLPQTTEGEVWIPKSLSRQVLQEESSNALLKSIEEPPERTTFIFLTKDKSDLLETIISRSQSFYIPSKVERDEDFRAIADFSSYPDIDRLEIGKISSRMLENAKLDDVSPENLIVKMQAYIKNKAVLNFQNQTLTNKMLKDIKILNETISQIKSFIKPQIALENALFEIYKNHR